MYKIILLLFVVSGLITDIYGQSNRKFYLSLDKGVSVPVGQFGKKEYTLRTYPKSNVNGLAQPGFQFNLSGGYLINEKIAIHSQIGYAINKQDEDSYEDFFSRNLAVPYNITVEARSWKIFKAMLGVKAYQNIGEKGGLFMEERLLAGITKTKEPAYWVEYISGSPPSLQGGRTEQGSTNLPVSFAWQLALGLGYNINSRVFFLIDMNYFDSKPHHKFTYTPPPYSSQSPIDSKFVYKLSAVGVTGSIGFRF